MSGKMIISDKWEGSRWTMSESEWKGEYQHKVEDRRQEIEGRR